MQFTAEHRFEAPPAAVAEVLVDPAFYRDLDLPDLARPEVLEASSAGGVATVRLRFEFVGHLDPVARRLVGNRPLAWVQELRLEEKPLEGALRFFAEAAPSRLRGQGRFTLEAVEAGSRRRLEGELVVAVPVLGRAAEGRIVPGVMARLDREAEALQARLRSCAS